MATPKVTTLRGLVAVTGGSGYIAGYCIVQLLNEGWRARMTVRNLGAAEEVRATISKITANAGTIEFILSSDAKCNTPRRFDIGKVVQDLKECCHAILFASLGRRKRPDLSISAEI